MANESSLCKKFLLSADWDRAIAALSKKDYQLSAEDYANRAYARCFQATKDHKDGKFDDAVADASNALVKDCRDRALCIRAYAYYLNNNYEAAITDCERIIERRADTINKAKETMKRLWELACEKIAKADEAKKKAEAAEKADASDKDALKQAAQTAADAAEAAEAAVKAQEEYCKALLPAAFAHELLGLIYTSMGRHHEASEHYKLALLARQTDIPSSSPLLMNAYRDACAAVKSY